jgi:disulfide bond formation protein DsbB
MRPEHRGAGLAAIVGGSALVVAWFAEHRLHMAPCAFCLLERWPYRALLVFGLAALLVPARLARLILPLCGVALLAAVGLSLTHLGVEQHWWPDPLPQCMAPRFHGGSIAERLASMPLRPAKPCDAPNRLFEFLPLSMASLDLIYALTACVLIGIAARTRRFS